MNITQTETEITLTLNKQEALYLQAMLYRCGTGVTADIIPGMNNIYTDLERFTNRYPGYGSVEDSAGGIYPTEQLVELMRGLK